MNLFQFWISELGAPKRWHFDGGVLSLFCIERYTSHTSYPMSVTWIASESLTFLINLYMNTLPLKTTPSFMSFHFVPPVIPTWRPRKICRPTCVYIWWRKWISCVSTINSVLKYIISINRNSAWNVGCT